MRPRFFFLLYLALFFLPHSLWATHRCEDILKKHRVGAQFLHQRNPELHKSFFVNQLARRSVYPKISPSSSPIDKLSVWLEHMENTHLKPTNNQGPTLKSLDKIVSKIKKYYFDRYLIKPQDVPESYFELQKRIARERGDGDYTISEATRKEIIKHIIAEQRFSLEKWLDYFLSDDTSIYPMWAKYWSFTGLVKLGSFDKEKGRFTKRTLSTVAPFPELNRESLAYVIDAIIKKANKESLETIQDPIFLKLLEGADFGALYTQAFLRTSGQSQQLTMVKGEWIKYAKGSDHRFLFESLQGKNTGWCTAGESTARTHLSGGDFYVYYSHDQKGLATNPRIAIRMEDTTIAEVRGIGPNQNLDIEIAKTQILSDKLKEFGSEGERYQKADQQMKRLTALDAKLNRGETPHTKELRFLYEIDEPIVNLGYGKDPRIQELIAKRKIKEDISLILGVSQELISTTKEDALSGEIVYHYGDLDLRGLQSAESLKLPQMVRGNLNLSGLHSSNGLTLPHTVGGTLDLSGLQSAESLTLPKMVGGTLDLSGLESAEGITLPQTVRGGLDLSGLHSANSLTLPHTVGGTLDLNGLNSANGLTLPQTMGGTLDLNGLQSAKGLTLPEMVGGDLLLKGLRFADGLTLPQIVGGDLGLWNLQSIKGLSLPKIVGENLWLSGLRSAVGLTLPSRLGGGLYLGGLRTAKGLTLPPRVEGDLDLGNLRSAEGLTLPQKVGLDLILKSLRSAEGLRLPPTVDGNLDLWNLRSAKGITLPETVGGSLDLWNLRSTEGLTLPQKVGLDLILNGLQSAEGLTLPKTVGLDLVLKGLQSAEGLTLPQKLGGNVYLGN